MSEKSLYDRDFTAWVKLTTQQLKDKNFEHLDLENLTDIPIPKHGSYQGILSFWLPMISIGSRYLRII
ncbi:MULTISPECIES: DUF29 family protein [Pseudanabaena]|uniref:DUF29 family protein n=1 Tax=Pseudanabaena TaxID=1152 RepID=UPI00247AB683|nr:MULTISPECIES: DUF29 family protein [Pseudanabaena]MEA5487948.1 DUF29 family protein [Pseudanabaena sp. CCNP1317]WGS70966.1 DUF29 family protein [Pseudanabaena galeata CCNP1313]